MDMKSKRLLAIVISIAMLLPILAFAQEAPCASRMQEMLKSGKKIESTASFEISKDFFEMIMSSLSAQDMDQSGEEAEQQAKLKEAVFNMLSKLRIDFVSSMEGFSGTVGSEKAPLFDMAGKIAVETDEILISTGLIPGYVLDIKLPEGMMKKELEAQNPEKIAKIKEAVEKTFESYAEGVLKPAFEKSEGNFIINDKEFDVNYAGMLDTHMVAKLIQIVAEFIDSNEEIKDAIEVGLESQKAAIQTGTDTLDDLGLEGTVEDEEKKLEKAKAGISLEKQPESADDVIEQMNGKAKEMLDKDAENVANISFYENTESKDVLAEIMPVESNAFISTYVSKAGKNMDFKMIVKNNADDGSETDKPEEENVDWKKLEEDIVNGTDFDSMLIKVAAKDASDDDNLGTDVKFDVLSSGMPISIHSTVSETKAGEYKYEQKIAVTFMYPEPIITININAKESDKTIADVAEGEKIVLNEEDAEEASAKIGETMSENAPAILLQNLPLAFPEEADIIISSIMPKPVEGTVESN
jgi:hypothetical protein